MSHFLIYYFYANWYRNEVKEMNDKQKLQIATVKKIINKEITMSQAIATLEQSRRNINRLINKYKEEGEQGFIHKNKGKTSKNKKDQKIIEELEQLYLKEYYDYNFEAFYDEITTNYNISYDVMLKYFKRDDIISPLSHKATIKLYNEKMNKAINNHEEIKEEKLDLFESRQISFEKAHTRRSSNMYGFGQEIQMDACEKLWFGGIVSYLHLAVDKGTKKVLFGYFEYEELTRGYFILLFNMIINYGIPARIKTDNRNSFSNKNSEIDKTQFGLICKELDIELITTSISTSKANIERENKTFKDRLIAEFRHEHINNIEEANKYLNEVFIPKMNKKFSYEIDNKTSKMRPNKYSIEELKLIISDKYPRIIDNASSIKYNNKYYLPIDTKTGEVICFKHHTECTFIIDYDGDYWSKIENNYYKLEEIENREKTMKKEIKNKEVKENKKYIPPKNHPWRQYKN